MTQRIPASSAVTGFFLQFALRGLERRFAIVDLAGGQFEDVSAGCMPILVEQADATLGIERNDRCSAGMMDDLELCLCTVG